MKKIAFVLAGCGGLDGTELHEALYSFLAVKQLNCEYQCFSIDKSQFCVKSFLDGKTIENESRNVLQESARLVKGGNIKRIEELNADEFDILFFPGGQGSALNISTFLIDNNANYTVDDGVKRVINEFKKQNKPICAVCIAPMILAKSLKNITITIGNDEKIAKIIETIGNFHKNTASGDICVDRENKIITAPCFMLTKKIDVVYNEVYKVVKSAIEFD